MRSQLGTLRVYLLSVMTLATVHRLAAQSAPDCRCGSDQAGRSWLVLQAGGWIVDQNATVLTGRAELPLGRRGAWILVPGVTFAHGEFKSSTSPNLFIPELQLQRQLSRGSLRPYVGAGVGWSIVDLADHRNGAMATVLSGLRADLTPDWGVRLETEMRLSGLFVSGSFGWGLGISRRL